MLGALEMDLSSRGCYTGSEYEVREKVLPLTEWSSNRGT